MLGFMPQPARSFFQPSFKLKEKHRDGAKVIERYHRPATPYQRLLADPRTPEEIRRQLTALSLTLDPRTVAAGHMPGTGETGYHRRHAWWAGGCQRRSAAS
jgi:hypothetical protein